MNDHLLQSNATKLITLMGYIGGLLLTVFSIVMLFVDFANWFQYSILGCVGIGIFMLSNITIANHQRMELLLRIIKRQEEVFLEAKNSSFKSPLDILSKLSDSNPDIHTHKIKLPDDAQIEDISKVMNIIKEKVDEAFNNQKDSNQFPSDDELKKMPLDKLKELQQKCIGKEDYEKARVVTAIIQDKEGNNNTSEETE